MKKLLIILSLGILASNIQAQSPEKMSYQSIIRKANDMLVTNAPVGIRISILQGSDNGVSVYSETQTKNTNINGLLTLDIGTGTTVDNFSIIDWSNGPFFIKTETDPDGGTNYTISGTSQLLSVPFALYSKSSGSSTPGPKGDDGLSAYQVWLGQGNTGSEADYLNSLKGEQGPKGDKGDKGDNGTALPVGTAGNLLSYDGANWIAKDIKISSGYTGSNLPVNNLQPYLCVYYIIALQGVFPSRNAIDPYIGEISIFAGNFAPRGWAFCDGQLLPISQNTALFSILGTTFGGDGRTTFALPDLRGRTPVHPGQGPGLSSYQLGERSGSESIILNIQNLPSHNHIITYQ